MTQFPDASSPTEIVLENTSFNITLVLSVSVEQLIQWGHIIVQPYEVS